LRPLLLAGPAAWAGTYDAPAGSLGQVLARVGASAHATILVTDPVLAARTSGGVSKARSLRAAIKQAIKGIDAKAQFIDPHTIRVSAVARVQPLPRPRHHRAKRHPRLRQQAGVGHRPLSRIGEGHHHGSRLAG
jgi:hypothetical protein